jgi:maltose alpha-D-glucosyltransferase/alpha-amylase
MLQELVPSAVDGWTYALDWLRAYCSAKGDASSDATLPFAVEAEQLGAVTRALHETLASGEPRSDFDLRAATADDVRRWARNATSTIVAASAALERTLRDKRLLHDQASEAQTIVERRKDYVDWIERLVERLGADAGANTRTHGDYHLGQVLRSSAGQFLVIDFEGEPTRPLRERRARHSPLRDVAGMLRSFAYASAASCALSAVSSKHTAHSAQQDAEARAARWEGEVRDAFLRGYFSDSAAPSALLPRARENIDRLIALFEAEKVFYELQYELDHRPDWVWLPLRGIARLET